MLRAAARAARVDAVRSRARRRDAGLHLDQLVEEHLAAGMSPDAAREAARRDFGGDQLVEESRDARGVSWSSTPGRTCATACG